MDKEKLKKIAFVAVHGTGNEKSNACRILKNLGYDEPKNILLDFDPVPSKQTDNAFCPGIHIDFDIQELVDEIEKTIRDGLSRKIRTFFKNLRF
jgi:hypothetical protein